MGNNQITMEKRYFTLNTTLIWIMVVISLILTIVGTLAIIKQWQLVSGQWIAGLVLLVLAWVVIVIDMNRNDIFNKKFWILSMLIIPSLTSILYLIQRKKLIYLGKEFGHKAD